MPYRIAVLDDDESVLQKTKEMLLAYAKEHPEQTLEISCYSSMAAFMEAVCGRDGNGQWAFDLLFMDIYLPDGNGIDGAGILRGKGFEGSIIFQSSSAEYAIDAFSVKALQYLIKPVSQEELDKAIGKAIEKTQGYPVLEYGKTCGQDGTPYEVPYGEKKRGSLSLQKIIDTLLK